MNKSTRKERERTARRTDILRAAANIFAEKGFEGSTLEEISEAAEYGKGTIYHYFQNKEEIYSAILDELFSNYLNLVKDVDKETSSLKDFFEILSKGIINYSIENKSAFLLLVQVRLNLMRTCSFKIFEKLNNYHEEILKIYHKRINKAIKNEEIVKVNPRALSVLFKGMILSHLNYLMIDQNKEEIDVESEVKFILNILFDGIKKIKVTEL